MGKKKAKNGKPKSRLRRLALRAGFAFIILLGVWGAAADWYVHHPRQWLARCGGDYPKFVTAPLLWLGNPVGDLTDALDWTGHDAVYEYDTEAPAGELTFAGCPRRVALPAPNDIRVLDRGEFRVGWSDSLRHPVWVAYHVRRKERFKYDGKRPKFARDKAVAAAPAPGDYAKSGFDRGHLAPNYAIFTRYGADQQKKTFLTSNIAPQTPALNRGVWRDVEHRIAEYWTARYGEIWVVVGCVPSSTGARLPCGVDVPDKFFQVVIAQEKMDVRAFAVVFNQRIPYGAYAARNLATIDEVEQLTGLDFNPEMPEFLQSPLEAELPTRLWPVRLGDVLPMILGRLLPR